MQQTCYKPSYRNHTVSFSFLLFLFFPILLFAQHIPVGLYDKKPEELKVGAERMNSYLPLLKNKNVAVVAHQASLVNKTHLVDTLLQSGIKVKKIFAPEHGFRGDVEAGGKVATAIDKKTGLAIISLYGKNKKPKSEDLTDVDIVLFDLQDVGARFYTYISTLHYVMEACAENGKQLIVLDRPNPNGYYVDGPVLDTINRSFVGMHPVPIVYGMTIGEYAQMINGEKWLANRIQCKLKIIPIEKYKHTDLYELPVRPSPNLPNMSSVYLYPSLCLFEGTMVSVGRGTDKPFQQFGYPGLTTGTVRFTPHPIKGVSENPLYNGKECQGFDVSLFGISYTKYACQLNLFWIINLYEESKDKGKFFNSFFLRLAGTDQLQKQIETGKSEQEIKSSWADGIKKFKQIRKKYLLYEDFE